MTEYLTFVEVTAIHADQIARYGGAQGVRDEALLDAAVKRPRPATMRMSWRKPPRSGKASAKTTLSSTATNGRLSHPTTPYLAINGFEISANAESAFAFLNDLCRNGEFKFPRLYAWLKTNTRVNFMPGGSHD